MKNGAAHVSRKFPFGSPWKAFDDELKQIDLAYGTEGKEDPKHVDIWYNIKEGNLADPFAGGSVASVDAPGVKVTWQQRYTDLKAKDGQAGHEADAGSKQFWTELELAWRLAQLNTAMTPILRTSLYRRTETGLLGSELTMLGATDLQVEDLVGAISRDQFDQVTKTTTEQAQHTIAQGEWNNPTHLEL